MARVPRRTGESPSIALSPEEEHLLNSVDGVFDERELAFVAGMTEDQVGDMLERLAMIGVIDLGTGDSGRPAQLPQDGGDGVELGPEERQEIAHLASLLKEVDYYELLGLGREARPADIKRAYYRLAPRYHPDRYFGKDLGPFKLKIENIFAALTKAHDTLRYPKRRATYDAGLGPLRHGGGRSIYPDHVLNPDRAPPISSGDAAASQPAPSPRAVAATQPRFPRSSGGGEAPGIASGEVRSVPPARSSVPSHPGAQAHSRPPRARESFPGSGGEDSQGRVPRSDDDQPFDARATTPRRRWRTRPTGFKDAEIDKIERAALARKLAGDKLKNLKKAGKYASEARVSQLEPGSFKAPEQVRKSAAEMFRARYDTLADAAKGKRLEKYVEQGTAAMESGDFRTAAAAFQQAVKLAPDDPELIAQLEAATSLALRS